MRASVRPERDVGCRWVFEERGRRNLSSQAWEGVSHGPKPRRQRPEREMIRLSPLACSSRMAYSNHPLAVTWTQAALVVREHLCSRPVTVPDFGVPRIDPDPAS
jgi:hypothetical protein